MNKSNAFYVGSLRNNPEQPLKNRGLAWAENSIAYLGIVIPIDKSLNTKNFQLNFENVLDKICSVLDIWRSREKVYHEKLH